MNFRRVGASFGVSRPFVVDRNSCHFLWYGVVAGEGLRSVGANREPPNPRACALSCPSPAIYGPGSLGHLTRPFALPHPEALSPPPLWSLYNACIVGRVVSHFLLLQRGCRFAPPLPCAGPWVVRPWLFPVGRAHATYSILLHPRARLTGLYHGSEFPQSTCLRPCAFPRS